MCETSGRFDGARHFANIQGTALAQRMRGFIIEQEASVLRGRSMEAFMTTDVWIGAVLSVPVGVATGLAVPTVQRWLESRGKDRAVAKLQQIRQTYEETLSYRNNPHLFTQFLLQIAIKTTFIAAAAGIIGRFGTVAGEVFFTQEYGVRFAPWGLALGEVMAIVTGVLIIAICRPALGAWRRVREFDSYVETLPDEVRDRDREAMGRTREG